MAGLRAPHPGMGGINMWGLPRTPAWGKVYMRGFTPHPDREPLYMGLRPMPHLGIFFGKKIPKNPKKPNCIGFKLSNKDSEQGCQRQPCYMCSANGAFSFSAKILKLKVRSFKEYTAKRNKARLSFQPCFRYLSGRRSLFLQVNVNRI